MPLTDDARPVFLLIDAAETVEVRDGAKLETEGAREGGRCCACCDGGRDTILIESILSGLGLDGLKLAPAPVVGLTRDVAGAAPDLEAPNGTDGFCVWTACNV